MAGPLEDLVKSLDLQPADIATLFAGLRASVPVYAAMGATGLNEGEDEQLRRIYGPLPSTPVPRETPEMQQRRMIEEFEQRFPTPELRAAVLEQMRANRRVGRYDPATATRRIDFAPHTQPEYRGPVMTPSIGKRKFQAGGSAKKTVQQMADEMLLKGKSKPVKETVHLSRRGFFGLPESKSMPLATIDDKALEKLEQKYSKQGQAPTITEKKVEVSPDAGKTRSTLKSIIETPVSRRTVLQAAGSQALQGLLPAGALPSVTQVAKPVVEAVTAAPTVVPTIGGLLARALKMGLDEKQSVDFIHSMMPEFSKKTIADHLDSMYPTMKDPFDTLSLEIEDTMRYADDVDRAFDAGKPVLGSPVQILGDMISPTISHKGMNLRPTLRGIRKEYPEKYDEMIRAARDAADYLYEP